MKLIIKIFSLMLIFGKLVAPYAVAETKVETTKTIKSMIKKKSSNIKAPGGDGESSKEPTQQLINVQTNSRNTYVSEIDQDLAIKSIVLLPVTDNVGAIYSNPIAEELKNILDKDQQWSLAQIPPNLKYNSEMLEENHEEVKKILLESKSEAALMCNLIKGPRGISIYLTLFVGRDGLPFLQETLQEYKGFEIADIRTQVAKLFVSLRARMPFRGNIISRRGQQVTLNLGSDYGLRPENHVSVVQILKVHRHPKLNFLVSTDKEVLGRVKLFKVERYLSFGYVELEKEPGVISVGAKVMPDEFVKYSIPVVTSNGKVLQDISLRQDKEVSFGEEPVEWIADSRPQYGKVEILAGVGSYAQNAKLSTAGSVSGANNLTPNILVRGELWFNSELYMNLGAREAMFNVNNGLSGSSPGSLSISASQYLAGLGYNFLLTDKFFGPKMQVSAGYMQTSFNVNDSIPTAFTSMKYNGVLVSVAGQFPLSDELPVDIGGKLDLYINPILTENITSGKSSSNQITSFDFFIDYRVKTRFNIHTELLFESYNSSFSGSGARTDSATSIDHKLMTLMSGVQYLF